MDMLNDNIAPPPPPNSFSLPQFLGKPSNVATTYHPEIPTEAGTETPDVDGSKTSANLFLNLLDAVLTERL